jgi:hypothetical protein
MGVKQTHENVGGIQSAHDTDLWAAAVNLKNELFSGKGFGFMYLLITTIITKTPYNLFFHKINKFHIFKSYRNTLHLLEAPLALRRLHFYVQEEYFVV